MKNSVRKSIRSKKSSKKQNKNRSTRRKSSKKQNKNRSTRRKLKQSRQDKKSQCRRGGSFTGPPVDAAKEGAMAVPAEDVPPPTATPIEEVFQDLQLLKEAAEAAARREQAAEAASQELANPLESEMEAAAAEAEANWEAVAIKANNVANKIKEIEPITQKGKEEDDEEWEEHNEWIERLKIVEWELKSGKIGDVVDRGDSYVMINLEDYNRVRVPANEWKNIKHPDTVLDEANEKLLLLYALVNPRMIRSIPGIISKTQGRLHILFNSLKNKKPKEYSMVSRAFMLHEQSESDKS